MYLYSEYEAVRSALHQLRLRTEDTRLIYCRLCGGYYSMELRTDWLRYECFMNASTGEMPGLNYEPIADDTDDGICCEALLCDGLPCAC